MAITVRPWQHPAELAYVRDNFYPHHAQQPTAEIDLYAPPLSLSAADNTTLPQPHRPHAYTHEYIHAIRRVQIWTFRSPRNVPHAVTATAALVDAKVHDELGFVSMTEEIVLSNPADDGPDTVSETSQFSISETAMKSIYAMAFVRFVNGFVDRDVSRSARRTGLSKLGAPIRGDASDGDELESGVESSVLKNAGESSMYTHAVSIGMPSAFVDLRHQCVHGDVPELRELRKMNGRALEWLWDRWWRENATGDAGRWRWEMDRMREREKRNTPAGNDGKEADIGDIAMLEEEE